MAAGGSGGEAAQKALQSVAQSTGWTYSLLWRLCPRQGALVWAEGYYNGAIRTRKTTMTTVRQPAGAEDAGDEETALRRSRQLKELYDSLAAGEAAYDGGGGVGDPQQQHQQQVAVVPPPRRPVAALAPEDLTETEWFYLMCASYCFPPAVGLPGEAFVRRAHVWLCGANKADSKVFSRAILARTVACIPVDDGVLEIGTTEKVEEDIFLIQHVRNIFVDQHGAHIMPTTLSGYSTSTPTTQLNHQPFQTKTGISLNLGDEHNSEMEDDDDGRIDLENNTENDSTRRHLPQDASVGNELETLNAESSGPMLIANLTAQDEYCPLHRFHSEDLSSKYLQSSGAEDQAAVAENAHYIKTVLTILRFNACRQTQAASSNIAKTYLALSKNSPFSKWNWKRKGISSMLIPEGTQQRMLKSVLLGAPSSSSHRTSSSAPETRGDDGEGTSRSRRGPVPSQTELSASHVLKERRRREKLNEGFAMLRSLVPFMDRASILGDTIEYVKQLRRRIQELESRARLVGSNQKTTMAQPPPPAASTEERGRRQTSGGYLARAGTCSRAAEASGNSNLGEEPPAAAASDTDTEVQVSIIGSDALLELRCPHREGLLLRVMQALHQELRLEITYVQASSAGDVLLAKLRAKVKEVHGRRSSTTEVKRAIHLIVSSDWNWICEKNPCVA
ncbi:Transcription factor TT8 [Zea mays]|uniref:Transcription factor TT8 n=1 Tax=Zea mays TaxID=4577 RepID=A0A1D6HW08_MAIZE|nr:Transcription factor TT8 [Zea mays]